MAAPFSASFVASNGPSFRIRSSRPHRWRGSSTSSGTTSARSSAPRARRTRGGALEAARQATAAAEAARKAAEDADDEPLAREHRFSFGPADPREAEDFPRRARAAAALAGCAPSELRGFTSELATVEDDSDADCCAQLAATNTLYLASSDARVIAQKLAKSGKYGAISRRRVAGGPLGELERRAPRARRRERRGLRGRVRGPAFIGAALRPRTGLPRQIGRALIFPDDERLTAADKARGVALFKRVSRESPAIAAQDQGPDHHRRGRAAAALCLREPGDGQPEAAEKAARRPGRRGPRRGRLRRLRRRRGAPGVGRRRAAAAARAELERLENDKARSRPPSARSRPDNAFEEAPKKRKAEVDVMGSLKKRKRKRRRRRRRGKKKRAAAEEPASPKRARDEPDDWDFDNGVDE